LWLTSMAFSEERQGESKVSVARDAKRRGNILASGGRGYGRAEVGDSTVGRGYAFRDGEVLADGTAGGRTRRIIDAVVRSRASGEISTISRVRWSGERGQKIA
jgi:hypothetical protein